MSSLRPMFLALSRMPPTLMLVLIIGLAVIITMIVSSKVTSQEQAYQATLNAASANSASANQFSSGVIAGSSLSGANHKNAIYSRSYIPSGTTIESKQIELKNTNDLELWDDAAQDQNMVVGARTRHAIPANSQIRKIDLNDGSSQ